MRKMYFNNDEFIYTLILKSTDFLLYKKNT